MHRHTDVVTYHRSQSPFGDELPVAGFVHRVERPGAPGGIATLVIESVEVTGDEVVATITTYEGPLCPVPAGAELRQRSGPAGATATLPRRAEGPSGA